MAFPSRSHQVTPDNHPQSKVPSHKIRHCMELANQPPFQLLVPGEEVTSHHPPNMRLEKESEL
ncbi:hypothetical protein FOIG_14141 [Fusarium odoratissimum NRRL 54006]|uniref:Uncharacterized protein n=1 Tax=Fusarium odoratissimum (strain NRRL 54006) TaxID=1089451 RepID=X0J9H6_FUSO5|nr:uncharacterized protein FOIG_14141 [Fusarium odoratissimum NRRL 54006]EXL92975.1 hypothetical protein FOIG_14141 [Fusarium odoratissimum NRRL 54006]